MAALPAADAHRVAGAPVPVRADVRGHDRVHELQASPGRVGQRLDRPAPLHPLLRVAELLAADQEHGPALGLRAAGRVPDPIVLALPMNVVTGRRNVSEGVCALFLCGRALVVS